MYSPHYESAMREKFWSSFGRYVSPVTSASGEKINWVNYKTGIKNIQFKMTAGKSEAVINIEITGEAQKINKLFILFLSFKLGFEKGFERKWKWIPEKVQVDGKVIACIFCSLEEASIFNKEDWPTLITFFKTSMITLDEFWVTHKEIFLNN